MARAQELIDRGAYREAVEHLHGHLSQRPDDPYALLLLGRAHLAEDGLSDAVVAFRRVLDHDPENVEAHLRLAQIFYVRRELDEAQRGFQRVLALEPGHAAAYLGLGHALLGKGSLEEANRAYRNALEADPTLPGASVGWVRTRRFIPEDHTSVEWLESLLGHPGLSREARVDLRFALGKVMDDLGRYPEAFAHFAAGNELVAERGSLDQERFTSTITRIIETFSVEYFAARPDYGLDSEAPVFVVGMPRAGTTLVEQIIASHPDAFGADELPYLDRLTRKLTRITHASERFPRSALRMTREVARDLAREYLTQIRVLAPHAGRVVDKMPANFFHLGFVASLFPRSRVVHCRRDPLDVCLSIYFQQFDRGHEWAYELASIAAFYKGYARLMAHWRTVLPIEMHEVDYEALVAAQEEVTRDLIAYCGLTWDEKCLQFFENRRPVHSASNWQVRQPIYRGAAGRWRNYAQYLDELKEALADDGV